MGIEQKFKFLVSVVMENGKNDTRITKNRRIGEKMDYNINVSGNNIRNKENNFKLLCDVYGFILQ